MVHAHAILGKEGSLKDPFPHCVAFVIIDGMVARTEMKARPEEEQFAVHHFYVPAIPDKWAHEFRWSSSLPMSDYVRNKLAEARLVDTKWGLKIFQAHGFDQVMMAKHEKAMEDAREAVKENARKAAAAAAAATSS